jgi:uncharacterized membrane protein
MSHTLNLDPNLLRPKDHVAINLLLAIIPVVLAFVIARGTRAEMHRNGRVRWLRWSPLLLLWLIFLPNTCYLLTEWRHFLDTIVTTPVYVATYYNHSAVLTLLMVVAFYLLYTGAGLWTFFLALWPLDRLTRRRLGSGVYFVQGSIFLLCALGVYLGLVKRINSTDALHVHRLQEIVASAVATVANAKLDGLLLVFAAILWFLYFLFDIWMDGALARVRALRHRRQSQ